MGKCENVFMERCEKGRGAARHALAAPRITRQVFVIYDLTIYYLRFGIRDLETEVGADVVNVVFVFEVLQRHLVTSADDVLVVGGERFAKEGSNFIAEVGVNLVHLCPECAGIIVGRFFEWKAKGFHCTLPYFFGPRSLWIHSADDFLCFLWSEVLFPLDAFEFAEPFFREVWLVCDEPVHHFLVDITKGAHEIHVVAGSHEVIQLIELLLHLFWSFHWVFFFGVFVLGLLLGGDGIATDETGDTDGADEEAGEPPDTDGQKGHGAWGMLRVVCGWRCCWVNLVIEFVKEFVDECKDELQPEGGIGGEERHRQCCHHVPAREAGGKEDDPEGEALGAVHDGDVSLQHLLDGIDQTEMVGGDTGEGEHGDVYSR